jgi:histidine triad (HIT) family protein
MMEGCIFCKIAKGEIPSAKVYEDESILAFLDISPANKGHTLIIPKEHFETLTDIPAETLSKMMETVKKVSEKVEKNLKAEGYTIMMSNREAGEQVVKHAHIHVMPRYKTDDFKFAWTHKKYEEGEIDKVLEKIKLS